MTYCVYMIGAEDGPVKIGFARDLGKRLTALQSGTHEKLSVITQILTSSRGEAADREKELHKRFSHLRIRGEWFRDREQILPAFPQCAAPFRQGKGRQWTRDDRCSQEPSLYEWLLTSLREMSDECRSNIAAIYKITDNSPEALATHRAAQIRAGHI